MSQSIRRIRSEKLCRDCLNVRYGLELKREHCRYWQYPGKCASCAEVRNIVADIVTWQRWRLWFPKKNKQAVE